MNQKIPFHELAKRLSLATSISNESAEVFIKNFFDLLSESLVSGETVRIKGLGTFAPATTDGESCVEFTPDKEIADTLNAPFAPFEAVELNEEVTDEMLEETSVEAAIDDSEPETCVEENFAETITEAEANSDQTSTEIVAPPEIIEAETKIETEVEPETLTEPEADTEPEPESESKPESNPESESESESPQESKSESEPESKIASNVTSPEAEKNEEMLPAKYALEEEPEEYVEHVKEEESSGGGSFGWGFLVGLLVGLALGACAVYLAIDYLFPNGRTEQTEQIAEADEETILTEDTVVAQQADMLSQPQESIPATSNPEKVSANKPIPLEVPQATPQQTAPVAKTVHDTVRKGYSLVHMAKKHYGSKDFWVYIYEENKAKIKNPNRVQPGEVFVIPAPEKYGINSSSEESIAKAKSKAGQILSKFK